MVKETPTAIIKRLRRNALLSQSTLGEAFGLSPGGIARIESGSLPLSRARRANFEAYLVPRWRVMSDMLDPEGVLDVRQLRIAHRVLSAVLAIVAESADGVTSVDELAVMIGSGPMATRNALDHLVRVGLAEAVYSKQGVVVDETSAGLRYRRACDAKTWLLEKRQEGGF